MKYPSPQLVIKNVSVLPRIIILVLDLLCVALASFSAVLLTANFNIEQIQSDILIRTTFALLILSLIAFQLNRSYFGIVRYTGPKDVFRLLTAMFSFVVLIYGFKLVFIVNDGYYLSNLQITLLSTLSLFNLVTYRYLVKYMFSYLRTVSFDKKFVVIYGASEAGIAAKRALDSDRKSNINVIAFIDDDPKKQNKLLDGIKIFPYQSIQMLSNENQIDELIVASFTIPAERKNELVDFCLNNDIRVLGIPSLNNWSDGGFSPNQFRKINIEELLEREPIDLVNHNLLNHFRNKRVLVTGAAGSIGRELVHQLVEFKPEMIIMLDQAETPLHELELALQERGVKINCITFLADITDENRLRSVFENFAPHYVYHAAAYKHVPMMELNPVESVKTNVFGTKLIADLSVEYKIERFVMVSTDKAVNPTNVMGATKRLAEMYVQGLSVVTQHTKFITTRFGNVLGSNGSVILRFKEQIENGGPVTVTHPNITRYFMTIPEACILVIEAGCMGNGGEIFVFDMGEPVLITELAKKMIRLCGLIPNIDIQIKYTGLRPGEKLYEELLNDGENTTKTHHQKIMIAKVREVDFSKLKNDFIELELQMEAIGNEMGIVSKMKEIVPEFVSNNSRFQKLDQFAKLVSIK
jgi:FlaA1/EpsC-like NDP-sugar epimerase